MSRYRISLVRERASEVIRLQKVLGDANIKLASVVTDITGVSARSMLEAIVGGSEDAEALAQLARRRLRLKLQDLHRALEGRVTDHHHFILAEQLAHLDLLEEAIERVSVELCQPKGVIFTAGGAHPCPFSPSNLPAGATTLRLKSVIGIIDV